MTPAEAKAVWDSVSDPSFRKVMKVLKAKGVQISVCTLQKMKASGWTDSGKEAKRAARRLKGKPAPKLVSEFLAAVNDQKTEEQARDFTNKSHICGLSTSLFLFLGKAESILDKHPQAFASIITAFSGAIKDMNAPRVNGGTQLEARLIEGPTPDQVDQELREFMEGV